MKNHFNKTKLIATIGPSCESEETLKELFLLGLDVCRINFSHGSHSSHGVVIDRIRKLNESLNMHVAILADLQGPKIRLGEVENNSITINNGDKIILTSLPCIGTNKVLHITYKELVQDIAIGQRILIDDGKIELKCIEKINDNELLCEVIYGGKVLPKKGVNLPDTIISQPSLTKKDFDDLMFALDNNVEWIALSFVRSADDIIQLKKIIKEKNSKALVIAKIEKPEAITQFDSILEATDAVMVARGDLGVEVPIEKLPFIQKNIVQKCITNAKPVIIATHIMESMIKEASPTRAEVNDVANAMLDGADALMLSAETASGLYPVKTVSTIIKIMQEMELSQLLYNRLQTADHQSKTFLSDAICYNACKIANDVNAKAIIGMTRSGYTAFKTSSYRPKAEIFIFSDNKQMLNTLNLLFGVRCLYYNKFVSTDQTINDLHLILKENGFIQEGDVVLNLASMPIEKEGRTNMLKVSVV